MVFGHCHRQRLAERVVRRQRAHGKPWGGEQWPGRGAADHASNCEEPRCRPDGGRLQIENLRIAAAGAVLLVNGTVTLSKDGYINGPIVLAYNNIDALGKFIDALRPGTATKNAGNLQQLDRATRVISTPEGDFHQTALLAVEGRLLFLGILPLPIDPIPPLKF